MLYSIHSNRSWYLEQIQISPCAPHVHKPERTIGSQIFSGKSPRPPNNRDNGTRGFTQRHGASRVATSHAPQRDQRLLRELVIQVQANLKDDLWRFTTTAVTEVESLLVPDLPLENYFWIRIRGWYCDTADIPPSPPRFSDHITDDSEANISLPESPLGRSIPVVLTPFQVAWSVFRLHRNRSGGASGMR